MRSLLVVLLLVAACRHAPEVREGPAMALRFAPPEGGQQTEVWRQERQVSIEFQGGEDRSVSEVMTGRTVERFEALAHGGWRVTATVLEETLERDGERMPMPLPTVGVPFSHLIDPAGRFVASAGVDETLRSIRERAQDIRVRRVLDSVLTPELIERRVERSWRVRYDDFCQRELSPGEVSFAIEEEELPAGGTVRMLVRRTVIGQVTSGGVPGVEISLEFGGISSHLAREEGARKLLARSGGVRSLTPRVEGSGVRIVLQDGCHIRHEVLKFKGESELNEEVARAAKLSGLPEHVSFSIARTVDRH